MNDYEKAWHIEQSKHAVELADALARLYDNKDFQKVFLEEYVEKDSCRLIQLMREPTMYLTDKQANREDFHERMIGIARFAEFIRDVRNRGITAKDSLYELQHYNASIKLIEEEEATHD